MTQREYENKYSNKIISSIKWWKDKGAVYSGKNSEWISIEERDLEIMEEVLFTVFEEFGLELKFSEE